ncbi:capsular polysaccharide synthesis protein [Sphingobacterium haloxyli]|uniref:Capsular biosynthesis protein n=1 Tax=Sphingobacterium haloxyli TaxID=2100533 RepID=A0A2S9J619_9SPHI|nr:capsular polysaccharide synthesis protein [Sphingobacterium haloxyli]PRD48222.1 capsular biosynthesis protein [Sphingobacterium haloxyli]
MGVSQIPLVKAMWSYLRKRKILAKHKEVAAFWQIIIDDYDNEKLPKYEVLPKKTLNTHKIIWQYWGQGFQDENLPEVVSICAASVDRHKADYKVIRLDDSSIKEYLDIPTFVWEKFDNIEGFNRTFFSDLLRVALLNAYGGVWLDATVLLTGSLPAYLERYEYFLYQRDSNEQHKQYWESTYAYYWGWHPDFKVNMLSSIMFAQKNSQMIAVLLDLMLYYWQTQDKLVDYFCFQILYQELITGKLADKRCPIVSDVIPHLLQTKINDGCDFVSYEEAFAKGNIHKMSYFDEEVLVKFRDLITKSIRSDCL